MSRGSIVFRVIGILVLMVVLVVAGSLVFRAGYTQGVAQSPVVATAISEQAGQVIPAPYPPMHGYHYPGMWMHPFWGFSPFGCLFGFFLIFLFFGALRMIFFPRWHGRRHWHHHGYGPWGGPWDYGEGSEKQGEGKGPSGPTRTA